MKIRVVSSKEEINTLGADEEIVHLAFRPSNTDIFSLVMRCPNVKALHIPSSYKKTISKSARMYLEMQGIDLLEGDVWGHRKDINEYSEVSRSVFDRINDFKAEGLSDEEIAKKMEKDTTLSSEFIQFIIKKS